MNLSVELKKIVGNKNTITIIGVVLCVVILYIGYNHRINSMVELSYVPYAKETIQPGTKITEDYIGYINVPQSLVTDIDYFRSSSQIIGKYTSNDSSVVQGSLFYETLLTESDYYYDSTFGDVSDNETIINYHVNMDSTYANTMMPGDYVNIYIKINDNGTIKFGKFIGDVKILSIKDSDGLNVFGSSEESRTPYYMMFALPEDVHLLFRKALYLSNSFDVEVILIPRTDSSEVKDQAYVASSELEKFVDENTKMVSESDILSSTNDEVSSNNE